MLGLRALIFYIGLTRGHGANKTLMLKKQLCNTFHTCHNRYKVMKTEVVSPNVINEIRAWLDTVHNMSALSKHSGLSTVMLRAFQKKGVGRISTLEKLIEAKRNGPPPPHVGW